MAGKTLFAQKQLLTTWAISGSTTVSGSNASTSNILVISSTGFVVGQFVLFAADGSYHIVTAVPDATHITVSPAFGAAPISGTVSIKAYAPQLLYLALFTVSPSDVSGGTEASGGSYARVQLVVAPATWTSSFTATPSQISNAAVLTFATPTADWGVIVAAGIFDATTTGNLIWYSSVATFAILNGDPAMTIPIGQLIITEN